MTITKRESFLVNRVTLYQRFTCRRKLILHTVGSSTDVWILNHKKEPRYQASAEADAICKQWQVRAPYSIKLPEIFQKYPALGLYKDVMVQWPQPVSLQKFYTNILNSIRGGPRQSPFMSLVFAKVCSLWMTQYEQLT